jgi:hypothetical protein
VERHHQRRQLVDAVLEAGLPAELDDVAELFPDFSTTRLGGQLRGERLETSSNLHVLDAVAPRGYRDRCTPVRRERHKAFALQAPQCLADRDPRDAVLLRDDIFDQPLSGPQPPGDDP